MRLKYLIIFTLLITIMPSAEALIGIAPSSPIFINFQPNLEVSYTYKVFGATETTDILVFSEGELNEIITFDKDKVTSESGHIITAKLKLPEKLEEPGPHKVYISVQSISKSVSGPFVLSEKAQIPITIFVPYPGKYIDAEFSVDDVRLGEPLTFILNLINRGANDPNQVYAEVDIYDSRNVKVTTLETERAFMKSEETKKILLNHDSNKLFGGGTYRATATVFYDEESQQINKTFKVGTLSLSLINHTSHLEKDKLNKFNTEVQSDWNDPIENVFAKIIIKDKEEQTPSLTLGRFGTGTLSTFVDTTGLEKGMQDVNITIFYDKDKSINKISQVEIIEKFVLTPAMILIGVIILIILADIIWFFTIRRKKRDGFKEKQAKLPKSM